jgi:hypothetical protein
LLKHIFICTAYNGGSGSGYGAGASNVVGVSAFLQGPFSGGVMTTALSTNNFMPLAQPYNTAPWNYTGTESVVSIPTGVVDWVLVELRKTTAASSVDARRACFIKSDGSIVDLDGTSPVEFDKTSGNSYYVVIRHRNHLAIMSANALTLSSSLAGTYLTGGSTEYDFGSAQSQAFGTNAMRDLGSGYLVCTPQTQMQIKMERYLTLLTEATDWNQRNVCKRDIIQIII